MDREEPVRMVVSRLGGWKCCEEHLGQGAQKRCRPAHQEADVIAGGREHGIDAITLAPLQIIENTELTAFGFCRRRRGERYLAPELVARSRFALERPSYRPGKREHGGGSIPPSITFPRAG